MATLQYVLEEGHRDNWFESRLIVTLCVIAGISLVTFVVHELETANAVVDFRVFANRSYAAAAGLNFAAGMMLFSATPASTEACDDGNTTSADGCDAACKIEPWWICSEPKHPCHPFVCGDGYRDIYVDGQGVEYFEDCDDSNRTPGDGGNSNCTIEQGYAPRRRSLRRV